MAQPKFEPTTSRSFSGYSNPQPPGQVLNLEGFYLKLNEVDLLKRESHDPSDFHFLRLVNH